MEWMARGQAFLSRRQMLVGLGLVLAGCGSTRDATTAVSGSAAVQSPAALRAESPTAGLPVDDSEPNVELPTPAGPDPEPTPEPLQSPPATALPEVEFPSGIEPIRIAIPAIAVDADVIRLDIRGEPEVPEDFAQVGWYHQTRLPGEIGPAVLAGHIDSRTGPAVFYQLDELDTGDEIILSAAGSETRRFAVTDTGQYSKDALPAEVFGFGEPLPELRLITCGGTFDASSGHYRDNYVVYARGI